MLKSRLKVVRYPALVSFANNKFFFFFFLVPEPMDSFQSREKWSYFFS